MNLSNITSFITSFIHPSEGQSKPAAETQDPLTHVAESIKHQPNAQISSSKIGSGQRSEEAILDTQQTLFDSVKIATATLAGFISNSIRDFEFEFPDFFKETITEQGTVKSIQSETQVLDQGVIDVNLAKLRESIGKEKNLIEFRDLLKGMIADGHKAEAAKCIELLLEELEPSASTHHASGVRYKAHEGFDRDTYNNLTTYLSLTFKNFREYFNTIDPYKSGIDNTGLNLAGVEHILGRLSGEGKLHNIKCICCKGTDAAAKAWSGPYSQDTGNLTFQISQQIEQMKKIQGAAQCTFVVQQGGHFTPLFLEKTAKGQFNVIITESTGLNQHYIPHIVTDIEEAFKRSSVTKKSDVYIFGKARQFDVTNCAAFAIHDAVKMSKNAGQLFSWIAQNGKIMRSREGRVHVFNILPPTMMKTAPRSLVAKDSKLDAFLQKHTVRALMDTRDQDTHRVVGVEPKDFNVKVSKAFLKYERQLMTQLMLDGDFNF